MDIKNQTLNVIDFLNSYGKSIVSILDKADKEQIAQKTNVSRESVGKLLCGKNGPKKSPDTYLKVGKATIKHLKAKIKKESSLTIKFEQGLQKVAKK